MLADPWPFLAQVPLEAAAAERMRRRSYRFGSAHCRRCGDWDIHPDWRCHGAGPHAFPAGTGTCGRDDGGAQLAARQVSRQTSVASQAAREERTRGRRSLVMRIIRARREKPERYEM